MAGFNQRADHSFISISGIYITCVPFFHVARAQQIAIAMLTRVGSVSFLSRKLMNFVQEVGKNNITQTLQATRLGLLRLSLGYIRSEKRFERGLFNHLGRFS